LDRDKNFRLKNEEEEPKSDGEEQFMKAEKKKVNINNPNNASSRSNTSNRSASSLDGSVADLLASFTAESARFWKWLSQDPKDRSVERGRQHFHSMIKFVNQICIHSSSPTSAIDKQVQKLTSSFQLIDTKNGEPIPRFLMQQVTETLISLAGIIKGTIALNILNRRKSVFIHEKAKPKLTSGPASPKAMKVFRVMVVGHDGVGKSTMIRKFCRKDTVNVTPTQGIELKVYKFEMDGEEVELQILDAAGKRFFREVLDEFYHVVEGVLIVYDITSSESFGDIHLWMHDLDKYTFLQKIVVGNKSDLADSREVPNWRAQNLAEEYNVQYMEASCETGYNIDEAFLAIIRNIQSSVKPSDLSDDENDNFVEVEITEKPKSSASLFNSSKQPIKSSIKSFNIRKINKYAFFTSL